MYNYTTSLDTIADKITDAKNALEDANNLMDTRKAAKDYMSGLSEKDATLVAERKVYE
jgi:flagellar hook-associated protein FlgK